MQPQRSTLATDLLKNNAAYLLSVFVLLVYSFSLYPSIAGGDSAELTSAAATLGIAHPPGYPIYTLLGKLFSFLPIGSVAWRLNFFSAVCSAAAFYFFFKFTLKLIKDFHSALLCSLLFALSPLVYRYSIAAEVFSLNTFFCALSLYFFQKFIENSSNKNIFTLFFIFGFGLSNHHTFLFAVVPLAVFCLLHMKSKMQLNVKILMRMFVFFALGFLPYLYLPISSELNPFVKWGNAETFDGFIGHLLRREYGTFQLSANTHLESESPFLKIIAYFSMLISESLYLGIVPIFIGLYLSLKNLKTDKVLSAITVIFFIYIFVFHGLSNLPTSDPLSFGILQRFWILPNLIAFIWLGIGLSWLKERFLQKNSGVVLVFIFLMLSIQLVKSAQTESQSKNNSFVIYGETLLNNLPKNSILLVNGDLASNTILYLQAVENLRRDVKVVRANFIGNDWELNHIKSLYPEVEIPSGYSADLTNFIAANIQKFPIYIHDETFSLTETEAFSSQFALVLEKMVFKIVPKQNSNPQFFEWFENNYNYFAKNNSKGFEGFSDASWEHVIAQNFWSFEMSFLGQAVSFSQSINSVEAYSKTALALESALQRALIPEAKIYLNLGIIYSQVLSKNDPNLLEKGKENFKKYLSLVPASDPMSIKVRSFLGSS